MLSRLSLVLAFATFSSAFSCGGTRPSSLGGCQRDRDCPAGQGCVQNSCTPLPCGGCQPDEACGSDGKCAPAQGQSCANHTCPAAFPCNGSVCSKTCTVDVDCDKGYVCNSQLHSCAQCTFDKQCEGVAGKTHCDGQSGTCVACNANIDCTTAVGTGHYCDVAHTCKAGCLRDADCNASIGETCDGAAGTTPGKCIQCKRDGDCLGGAPSCDETNHCVQCSGATQAAANSFCGPGGNTPECNLATKTCVGCLPANNQSGLDCGYPLPGGTRDPHVAQTCGPANSCVEGCQFDEQCGCVRNSSGAEGDCYRKSLGLEHCDPKRTSMLQADGVTYKPSQGGCVQCVNNAQCAYKRTPRAGSRCTNDSCEPFCDSDADCLLPDAANPGATRQLFCQQTPGHDAQHKTCTECRCDVPGADATYCEVNTDGSAACAPASGSPRVCDRDTLLCRKKNQGELCLTSGECGNAYDPTVGQCLPTPGFCAFHSHPGSTTGGETYCSPSKNVGRCAVPCDDYFTNRCVGGTNCPSGSSCRAATNEASKPINSCVPSSCSYP